MNDEAVLNLSEKQAAAILGISVSTLRRWRMKGTGPAFFKFGDILRYRRDQIEQFISQNTREPERAA